MADTGSKNWVGKLHAFNWFASLREGDLKCRGARTMFSLLPQASPPPCGAGLAADAPDGDLHQGLHRFPIGIPSYASDGDCNSGAPLKLDGAPSCLLYRWSLSLYPMREVPTKHDMSLPLFTLHSGT